MQTGVLALMTCPVAARAPDSGSTPNSTIESLRWLAAKRRVPAGLRPMKRGVEPRVGSQPAADSVPFDSSTRKIPTLSCPRFDAYTNRPDGDTTIAAPVLLPVKVEGSDGTIWIGASVPVSPNRNAATVESSSLMTHAYGRRGWKAMWRGPAPDLVLVVEPWLPPDATDSDRQALEAALRRDGPTYIRICRNPTPVLFEGAAPLEIGRIRKLRDGADLTIAVCGVPTYMAIEAAERHWPEVLKTLSP